MVNESLKPAEEIKDYVPASEKHKKLQILVQLFDEPKIITGTHAIFSIITITEEDELGYFTKEFSVLYYDFILTQEDISTRFDLIKQNPFNYKPIR